jgi:hypothetical protein
MLSREKTTSNRAMLSVPGIARTNIVLQIDDVEVAAP